MNNVEGFEMSYTYDLSGEGSVVDGTAPGSRRILGGAPPFPSRAVALAVEAGTDGPIVWGVEPVTVTPGYNNGITVEPLAPELAPADLASEGRVFAYNMMSQRGVVPVLILDGDTEATPPTAVSGSLTVTVFGIRF